MSYPAVDIDHIFTYHPPTPDKQVSYQDIRVAARLFAGVLIHHTPQGADQAAALRLLRECVMTANAAIALDGRLWVVPPT